MEMYSAVMCCVVNLNFHPRFNILVYCVCVFSFVLVVCAACFRKNVQNNESQYLIVDASSHSTLDKKTYNEKTCNEYSIRSCGL